MMTEYEALSELIERIDELVKKEQYNLAIETIENQIDNFGDKQILYDFLGKLNMLVKDPLKAAGFLIKSLEIQPDNALTLELLGDAYYAMENWEETIISWHKVCEIDQQKFDVWKKLGELYYQIGEYAKATKALQVFLEYEENVDVYSLLADIFRKMGNDIESWNQLMKAEKLAPDNRRILIQIGQSYSDIGNYERAIDYFQKVVSDEPENAAALFFLGKMHVSKKNYTQAIEFFSQIIEIDPDNALAYYEIADIYASQAKIDEAIKMYDECLSKDPSIEEASVAIASLHWVSKKYEKALTYLKEALRYNKTSIDALQMIGDIYEDLDDEEQAEEYWSKVAEIKED